MPSQVNPCPWCGSRSELPLTNPHPGRSVLSDLRIVDRPLDKHGCLTCGVVWTAGVERPEHVYASSYELYNHPPGAPREHARQSMYAQWLAAAVDAPPRRVLDIGCGNGSLLLALRAHWPAARMLGTDLSTESIAHARAAGVDAAVNPLADARPADVDVAVMVNVIEHTADPTAFLRSAAVRVRPQGHMLLVCPNGAVPSVELLFLDHLWSFTGTHLIALALRSGLIPVSVRPAPAALGSFQLLHAIKPSRLGAAGDPPAAREEGLPAVKDAYLRRWASLDALLLQRAAGASEVTCFGTGEAAGLLRAYAPRTWSRVRACTADEPEQSDFGGVPVYPWRSHAADAPVLLGARPLSQAPLAARLESAGLRVIRWDDHIAA